MYKIFEFIISNWATLMQQLALVVVLDMQQKESVP